VKEVGQILVEKYGKKFTGEGDELRLREEAAGGSADDGRPVQPSLHSRGFPATEQGAPTWQVTDQRKHSSDQG